MEHPTRDSSSPTALRREVETPQRQPSGIGIMLVAASSMFFAVASSAFILRANTANGAGSCTRVVRPVRQHVQVPPTPVVHKATTTCGEATFVPAADGSTAVVFDLCDSGVEGNGVPDKTP